MNNQKFVINDIYEPQLMSDGVTYTMNTILSGQFRGLKVRAQPGLTKPEINKIK